MQGIKPTTEKHEPASRAIPMAAQIRQYSGERITPYGRSWDTLDATGRRHRASIRPVSPRRTPWSSVFAKKTMLWHCEIVAEEVS
jgi:hypothetical protein